MPSTGLHEPVDDIAIPVVTPEPETSWSGDTASPADPAAEHPLTAGQWAAAQDQVLVALSPGGQHQSVAMPSASLMAVR